MPAILVLWERAMPAISTSMYTCTETIASRSNRGHGPLLQP
jgi:hypothetical protein